MLGTTSLGARGGPGAGPAQCSTTSVLDHLSARPPQYSSRSISNQTVLPTSGRSSTPHRLDIASMIAMPRPDGATSPGCSTTGGSSTLSLTEIRATSSLQWNHRWMARPAEPCCTAFARSSLVSSSTIWLAIPVTPASTAARTTQCRPTATDWRSGDRTSARVPSVPSVPFVPTGTPVGPTRRRGRPEGVRRTGSPLIPRLPSCRRPGLPCEHTPSVPLCLLYTSDAADEEDSVDL